MHGHKVVKFIYHHIFMSSAFLLWLGLKVALTELVAHEPTAHPLHLYTRALKIDGKDNFTSKCTSIVHTMPDGQATLIHTALHIHFVSIHVETLT